MQDQKDGRTVVGYYCLLKKCPQSKARSLLLLVRGKTMDKYKNLDNSFNSPLKCEKKIPEIEGFALRILVVDKFPDSNKFFLN